MTPLGRAPRTCVRFALPLTLAICGARPVSASDWQQLGLDARPAWVSAAAERRLRLLSALPGIETTLSAQAGAYFGSLGPGLTVGLVLDDGLYYSRGFGFRDAAKSHKPDEQTVFCIGSMTKVFTGTTLLTLRDAGRLSLGDLASKHVPEIQQVKAPPCPTGAPCDAPVRLRHLVSHTSGLPNEMSPALVDEAKWLDELQHTRRAFPAGSFSAYSGVGVEMAGLVVKRVSGKPYKQAVEDLLLHPLGMTHSTFDMSAVPASRKAQNWKLGWNASFTAPRFTADSTWDDRLMLNAAGYLLSSVWDLARFDRVWLSQEAPSDILTETTLKESRQSLVTTASGAIPTGCGDFKDQSGASFSPCGDARGFGVNWYVGQSPYIQHNGSTGLCGSNTVLSPDQKMGASGLISTDPFPPAAEGKTLPPGIDGNFMGTVVSKMLTAGLAADAATNWQNSPLAVGVARYLWVMGVKMPTSMLSERREPPRGRRGAPLRPGAHHPVDTKEAQQFKQAYLAHFTPAYRALHHLDAGSVHSHLVTLRSAVDACSTFRVRRAPASNKVALRLHCDEGAGGGRTAYDVTLSVEKVAPYRIAAIEDAGTTSDPY